jgi:hypothetical protein
VLSLTASCSLADPGYKRYTQALPLFHRRVGREAFDNTILAVSAEGKLTAFEKKVRQLDILTICYG